MNEPAYFKLRPNAPSILKRRLPRASVAQCVKTNFVGPPVKYFSPSPPRKRRGSGDEVLKLETSKASSIVDSEALCRFLLSKGLTLDCVEDPLFLQAFSSTDVVIPKKTQLSRELNELTRRKRKVLNGPFAATIDLFRFNDEIFVTFSTHYYQEQFRRKNEVHLKKLFLCEVDDESLMSIVRCAIDGSYHENLTIKNLVVTSNSSADSQRRGVEKTNVCFYTYLTQFMDDVLRIELFCRALETLRIFVFTIRSNHDLYQKYQRRKNGLSTSKSELPSFRNNQWAEMHSFLVECLDLHGVFREFCDYSRINFYLNNDEYATLLCLQRLMLFVQKLVQDISSADSTPAVVVPALTTLKCFINSFSDDFDMEYSLFTNDTFMPAEPSADELRIQMEVQKSFEKYLEPLTRDAQNYRYNFACLFDPRYAFLELIHPPEVWSEIVNLFVDEIMENPSKKYSLSSNNVVALKRIVRRMHVDLEMEHYRAQVCSLRPSFLCSPFEWWSAFEQQGKYPNLLQLSREMLCAPAVAINGGYFFGRSGKYVQLCDKVREPELQKLLNVASQDENFIGRGSTHDARIKRMANIIKNPLEELCNSERVIAARRIIKQRPSQDLQKHDEYLEGMMMQAPPEKRVKVVDECSSSYLPHLSKEMKFDSQENETQKNDGIVLEENEKKPFMDFDQKIHIRRPLNMEISIEKSNEKTDESSDMTRATQNQLCQICGQFESLELMNCTVSSVQKLLILTGLEMSGKTTMEKAKNFFITQKDGFYACTKHFVEACNDFFAVLNVSHPDGVLGANLESLKRISATIEAIRDRSMDIFMVKRNILVFTTNFFGNLSPNILPKNQRPPRKQVLEPDTDDADSKLFTTFPVQDNISEQISNRAVHLNKLPECCYCGFRRDEPRMMRVPKSLSVRERWSQGFGDEFKNNLEGREPAYVCRDHFSPTAFSVRGRLLKGSVPTQFLRKTPKMRSADFSPIQSIQSPSTYFDGGTKINMENNVIHYDDSVPTVSN